MTPNIVFNDYDRMARELDEVARLVDERPGHHGAASRLKILAREMREDAKTRR